MSLLNENNFRMQFKAGIISEDRFELLMNQLRSEKEIADKYEEDKEEMYGLNENLKTSSLNSVDWDSEGRSYAGSDWDSLSKHEKDEVILFLKKGWHGDSINENLGFSKKMKPFADLMAQIKQEKEISDKYEEEKEELYGLNEGIDLKVFDKLLGQIKQEKEKSDKYESEKKEFLSESENYTKGSSESSNKLLTEDIFSDFLRSEYGDSPTEEEVALAITNWASNYMLGNNEADYDGVSEYMNDDVWEYLKNDISANYMDELRKFYKSKISGELEEMVGIKTKSDSMEEMVGIKTGDKIKEDLVNENNAEEIVKKKYDAAFEAIISSLPEMLKKADKDKDGIEIRGDEEKTVNERYLTEVLGLGIIAANTLMSAPGIISLAGKLMKSIGSIPGMNINFLKAAGEKVAQFGSKWQAKHMSAIESIMKKMMPNADEKTIERASKALFITIMATLAMTGGVVAGTGAEAETVNSALGAGKSAGSANKIKDFSVQLAKSDFSDIKSKLASFIPLAVGKVFG